MKIKDTATISGHALLVQFLATGSSRQLSVIRLDQGVTLSVGDDNLSLFATLHETGKRVLIDSFSGAHLADNALQEVRHLVSRYMLRRRVASWLTGALKWIVAPIVALMFVLSLNTIATAMLVSGGSDGVAHPAVQMNTGVPREVAATAPSALSDAVPRPEPGALASALESGANSGKYSVTLSEGTKGTLYVFSDPSCPYCRRLEPVLEALSSDYKVVVFPVSVVGGRQSQSLLNTVFCTPTGQGRASAWKAIAQGDHGSASPESCADASEAIAANDEFFRAMNFPGTPTIINAAGMEFPTNRRADAENLAAWAALDQKASR